MHEKMRKRKGRIANKKTFSEMFKNIYVCMYES